MSIPQKEFEIGFYKKWGELIGAYHISKKDQELFEVLFESYHRIRKYEDENKIK